MNNDPNLQRVQEAVADHMDAILGMFKPGCKITVLVRTPDHPDRDFLMTSDAGSEIIAAVQRRGA